MLFDARHRAPYGLRARDRREGGECLATAAE